MVVHRLLDEVFRTWSHVAVLRALVDTATGFTGNEVARVAGMHPRSALKALTVLENLGVVRRQRGGRDHIFTLNREHFIVRKALLPLYHAEIQFFEVIRTTLSGVLRKPVVSAVVFGSVATGEETQHSDFDLCCVVMREQEKETVREMLHAQAATLYRRFGVKVAPIFFTVDELRKKSGTPVVKGILQNGKLIAGKELQKLVNDDGETKRPKGR